MKALIIGLIIGFILTFSLISEPTDTGNNFTDVEELESRVAELEECVDTLQSNMFSTRSMLQNYGTSYEDLYNLIQEAEDYIEPEPFECLK